FCLAGNPSETLKKDEMRKWTFFLDISLDGNVITLVRDVDNPGSIAVRGNASILNLPTSTDGSYTIDIIKAGLGRKLFGLDISALGNAKNRPTYRNLISYFLRTGPSGFSDPFAHF